MRPLLAAFAFLTRIPVGVGAMSERDLGRSVAFFPLVGLVLGFAVSGIAFGLVGFLPTTPAAILGVALLALTTGALHLDGLADLFDGLAGGRGDRQRTLAIMRDSRIGAAGAVALVLVLGAKIAAVASLLDQRNFIALVAFPAIGRAAVVPLIVFLPYARDEGLGRAFSGEARPRQLIVAALSLIAICVALGAAVAMQAGAALLLGGALGLWLNARLGGLTGDVYGATIEVCETAALYVALIR